MKVQWIALFALALTVTMTSVSEASKTSRKDMKAFTAACKNENPKASKKAIRNCVKAKAKAARST